MDEPEDLIGERFVHSVRPEEHDELHAQSYVVGVGVDSGLDVGDVGWTEPGEAMPVGPGWGGLRRGLWFADARGGGEIKRGHEAREDHGGEPIVDGAGVGE